MLGYHNEALAALAGLDGSPPLGARPLAHRRARLFAIREDIVALITRLRGDS